MALIVENPGVWATVQDRGRPGYRAWGVPPGGAFDLESHDLANALLGNDENAATVELSLVGGVYRTETTLAIALVGAPMTAMIDRGGQTPRFLRLPGSATLEAGDRLVLRGAPSGARTYLAVPGGWATTEILGSRSTETPLVAGGRLLAEPCRLPDRHPSQWRLPDPVAEPIRIVDGPDAVRPDLWIGREFRVGPKCNRMGLRLEGADLGEIVVDPDRISAPVAFGTVQVAGGQLIILGPAGGTMGGYPHVAQVVSADLDRLGQARSDTRLTFRRVSLEEARVLDRDSRDRRARTRHLIACLARDGD